MSWMDKLYRTYEHVASGDVTGERPWPVSHVVKKAHVEVTIDGQGVFKGARKLSWIEAATLIPATEFSAARTRDIASHPLCEELAYCASDLPGPSSEKVGAYQTLLQGWRKSAHGHAKVEAVARYIDRKTLWGDLTTSKLLPLSIENAKGQKTKVADKKVFVRWNVVTVGEPCSGSWEDPSLIESWQAYDRDSAPSDGVCMVTGAESRIAKKHPKFLRHPGDGAKLISANDDDGYTYRGRFTDGKKEYGKQTCSVSFEASQKAHSALRWLIKRQGHRYGDGDDNQQVVVSWSVGLKAIPDPVKNTFEIFGDSPDWGASDTGYADTAQAFAIRLNKRMAGYGAQLGPTDDIVVLGLDSATPGRMAITYFRELTGSEFLQRIESWHLQCAWPQNFGGGRRFVGAPAPRDIAEAAFGRWDKKKKSAPADLRFLKSTVERLLPCIVDGLDIPPDLVTTICRRASHRQGLRKNAAGQEVQWEQCLGIACALFKALHAERNYDMALELDRNTRDYLYGRLLAIADHIEGRALHLAKDERDTNAARLMQRFAEHPASTWRSIELSLRPYLARLRTKRAPFLFEMETLMDEVGRAFQSDDFCSDAPLSGEFLLGFHCQRGKLREPKHKRTDTPDVDQDGNNEDESQ